MSDKGSSNAASVSSRDLWPQETSRCGDYRATRDALGCLQVYLEKPHVHPSAKLSFLFASSPFVVSCMFAVRLFVSQTSGGETKLKYSPINSFPTQHRPPCFAPLILPPVLPVTALLCSLQGNGVWESEGGRNWNPLANWGCFFTVGTLSIALLYNYSTSTSPFRLLDYFILFAPALYSTFAYFLLLFIMLANTYIRHGMLCL